MFENGALLADTLPRHPHDRDLLRRAGAARRWRSTRTTPRTDSSTSTTSTSSPAPATSRSRGISVSADPDVADPDLGADPARGAAPDATRTTTAGSSTSAPWTATSTPGTGDGGGGGDHAEQRPEPRRRCSARCCASTSTARAVPCGQSTPCPTRSRRRNPFAGNPSDCRRDLGLRPAQPLALLLRPARPATSSSATSARTRYEEVDFQPAASAGGENYGWHMMEGFHCYNPALQLQRRNADAAHPRAAPHGGLVRDHRRHALPRHGDPGAAGHVPLLRQLPGRHLLRDAGGRRELDDRAAQVHRLQPLGIRRGRGRRALRRGPRREQVYRIDPSPIRPRSPSTSCRPRSSRPIRTSP